MPYLDQPLTYKVEEAAKLLRIGRCQAYEAVATGKIPSIRIGRCIRIPRVALERLLEQCAGDADHLNAN